MNKLAPSTLEAKDTCSCFDYLQQDTKSDAADEGIMLHKACETGETSGLTDEQKDVVQNCLLYAEGLVAGHPQGTLRTIMKELKVAIPVLGSNGILDWVALFTDGTIECIDYKFGRRGATDAENNIQIFCYVLGLFERFTDGQRIRAHIINARLKDAATPFIFERSMIPRLEDHVRKIIDRAEDPFKKPCARDLDLCVRCAHATRCPAYNKTIELASHEIGETGLLPAVYEPAFISKPEDRARAHMLAAAMEQWAKDIKSANTEFVKNGGEVPGYKLISKKGSRSITNTVDAVDRLRATGTLADFDIWPCVNLPFGKLADQLAAVRKCTKQEAQQALGTVLGTLVEEGYPITYLQRGKKAKGELPAAE